MNNLAIRNRDKKDFFHSRTYLEKLKKFAQNFTGDYTLKVRYGQYSCYTVEKVVYIATHAIPGLDFMERIRMNKATMVHECGHALYTDFDLIQTSPSKQGEFERICRQRNMVPKLLHQFWNILEDRWIEKRLCREYPGVRDDIWWSNQTSATMHEVKGDAFSQFTTLVMFYAIVYDDRESDCTIPEVVSAFQQAKDLVNQLDLTVMATEDNLNGAILLYELARPFIKSSTDDVPSLRNEVVGTFETGKVPPQNMKPVPWNVKCPPSMSGEEEKEDDTQSSGASNSPSSEENSEDAQQVPASPSLNQEEKDEERGEADNTSASKVPSTENNPQDSQEEESDNGGNSSEDESEEKNRSVEPSTSDPEDGSEEENEGDSSKVSESNSDEESDEETGNGSGSANDEEDESHEDSDYDFGGETDDEESSENANDESEEQDSPREIDGFGSEEELNRQFQNELKQDERLTSQIRNNTQKIDVNDPVEDGDIRITVDYNREEDVDAEDSYFELMNRYRNVIRSMDKQFKKLFDEEDVFLPNQMSGNKMKNFWRKDGRIFVKKKRDSDNPMPAITVLVDMSDSMGLIVHSVRIALLILQEFCVLNDIPFSIITHQAMSGRNEVVIRGAKWFEEKHSLLTNLKPDQNTREGVSLEWTAKYIARQGHEKNWLLVISDGQPRHSGKSGFYGGEIANEDVRSREKTLRRMGIYPVGIGLEVDISNLYQQSIRIDDMNELPQKLFTLIKRKVMVYQ